MHLPKDQVTGIIILLLYTVTSASSDDRLFITGTSYYSRVNSFHYKLTYWAHFHFPRVQNGFNINIIELMNYMTITITMDSNELHFVHYIGTCVVLLASK